MDEVSEAGTKVYDEWVDHSKIAEALGVSERAVSRYAEQGMPRVPGPHRTWFYNVKNCRAWVQRKGLSGRVGRPQVNTDHEMAKAKLRKEQALAMKHELAVKEAAGQLMRVEDVRAERLLRVKSVKGALLALPGRLSSRLAHRPEREVYKELEEAVRDVLRQFAEEEDDDETG